MPDRIDIAKIAGITPKGARQRARRVAAALAAEWRRMATSELRSSAAEYRRGIVITQQDEQGVVVELVGTVPNLVEQGMGPGGVGTEGQYDVRRFVLKEGTSNLRKGKRGLYLHVPFGHKAADIKAAGGSRALRVARALAPTISGHGQTLWGGRMGSQFGARLAGMVRMEKTYSKARQSLWKTWRTMSEAGKPWISKGVRARWLSVKLARKLPKMLSEVL